MINKQTKEALDMFALGAISEEDVELVLDRSFSSLSREELDYIESVREDYENWLAEQRLKERWTIQMSKQSINPLIINLTLSQK